MLEYLEQTGGMLGDAEYLAELNGEKFTSEEWDEALDKWISSTQHSEI